MFNRFLVRPFLRSTTWIKRNPILTLALIALALWLVRSVAWSLENIALWVVARVLDVLAFLGNPGKVAADKILAFITAPARWGKVVAFVRAALVWLASLFFPPLAVFFLAWTVCKAFYTPKITIVGSDN